MCRQLTGHDIEIIIVVCDVHVRLGDEDRGRWILHLEDAVQVLDGMGPLDRDEHIRRDHQREEQQKLPELITTPRKKRHEHGQNH